MAKCRGCHQDNGRATVHVDGLGEMHPKCEIVRLGEHLVEANERIKQLEGHVLPGDFVSIKKERLTHLEDVERGVRELVRRVSAAVPE